MPTSSPSRPAGVLRVRVALSAAAVTAIALGTAAPATAAGLAPAGRPTTLDTPKPTATERRVFPIAASTDLASFGEPWAVYGRDNVVGNTSDATGDLIAVTASGKTTRFGVRTPDMTRFSLATRTLTAGSTADPSRVYWWHPASSGAKGGYHVSLIGPGARYLGSAPDGWVELRSDGTLYDVDATEGEAAAVSLGKPFSSADGVDGTSGPTGIVVWNKTQIAFVPFGGGPVTPLDVSHLTKLSGGTNTPQCWSASASAVACGSYYFTGEDNSGLRNVFLDRLDGSAAYAVSSADPQAATMLGARAGWLTDAGRLRVLTKRGVVTSSRRIGAAPVAGLGGFLTSGASHHRGIKLTPGAMQATTVLRSTKAASDATEFALTADTVTWMENGRSATAIHRRSVGVGVGRPAVNTGPIRRVGRSQARHGSIAAAGRMVAYPTRLTNSAVGQNGSETLRVVWPGSHTSIRNVDRHLPVTLGAHRVAYYVDDRNARVYDLKTHRTTRFVSTGIALSGHWLGVADTNGTIRLTNLRSGSTRTVATSVQVVGGQLFVHGAVVGWNAYPPDFGGHVGYYRDMATDTGVVQLPGDVNIWQLADAGLVLEQTPGDPRSASPGFPPGHQVRFHRVRFLLQPYDGSTAQTLLVASFPQAGPQVAGHVVAWVDRAGRLRARALS